MDLAVRALKLNPGSVVSSVTLEKNDLMESVFWRM